VHGSAQTIADLIYERFGSRAPRRSEYAWENGKRIDGDLTSLFIERQP